MCARGFAVQNLCETPFPIVFRLRRVSKRWCSLLSDDSSDSDVKAFRKEIAAVSSSLPSCAPLRIRAGCLMGYDARANGWSNLPMHDGKENDLLTLPIEPGTGENVMVRSLGPLLCWYKYCDHSKTDECLGVTVANIFTGKFKHLKTPPLVMHGRFTSAVYGLANVLFQARPDEFTIVLVRTGRSQSRKVFVILYVYESWRASWTRSFIRHGWNEHMPYALKVSACSILQDKVVLSITEPTFYSSLAVLTVKLKTKQTNFLEPCFLDVDSPEFSELDGFQVGICGSRIILVVTRNSSNDHGLISVFECTEGLRPLNREHKIELPHHNAHSYEMFSDDERLFLCWGSMICSYHLYEGRWTQLPSLTDELANGKFRGVPGIYSPGLNPFHCISFRYP